ncbi:MULTISPECIES: phosphosulfolactate synthase [unclassified Frankia]|uniref:phosphosulfolactate synthase n=1 Tax=unclassified Frankia TaxID=2632575 RepID=UPI001EF52282|nr:MULTISPECIES: phosphosulfolactate synthase [unclassified Frankia]
MIISALALPARQSKPRSRGITLVIDNGLPTGYFCDAVVSFSDHIDLVKFGWGTSLVTAGLANKINCLRTLGIDFFFGGTLFEKHILQNRFDDFRGLCHEQGCRYVEVSNGTIDLGVEEKASYVSKLADEFIVLSEVGFKDAERSERQSPSRWLAAIRTDLHAGAHLVILEARESGTSGICRPDGQLRFGLIEDILDSDVPVDRLVFEAPTKILQAHFIRRVGPEANLGNVHAADIVGLETLRLGLRSDTLLAFEPAGEQGANRAEHR